MERHCSHAHLSEEDAKEILGQRGLNRTKAKVGILLELSHSQRPISVQELHEALDHECDVSTIFRTISQFKEKNLVQEINLDEGFFRYELNVNRKKNDHSHHHHHHVRCRNCGDIQQIEKCDLSLFEKAISKLGFTSMGHRLEFTGLCSKCS